MEYFIRECVISDAQFICVLNREEMGYDYPADKTAEKLKKLISSENDRIYVAQAEDKVIGYIHANSYDVIYAPHMKNIMGIAVSNEYRKCGVGKALLDKVEQWAREDGADAVRLVSGAARTGAHEFYRRCGYDGGRQQLNFRKKV